MDLESAINVYTKKKHKESCRSARYPYLEYFIYDIASFFDQHNTL